MSSSWRERMSDWLQAEYCGYLAKIDDRITAYCLYRDDGSYYYLRHLFVDRGFRRQGIAISIVGLDVCQYLDRKEGQAGCAHAQPKCDRFLQAVWF